MKCFSDLLDNMKVHGMKMPGAKVFLQLPNAKQILHDTMKLFVEQGAMTKMEWLPEYNKVAKWLENNEGKGLFMYGNCGRGKTLLSRYVIPAIMLEYHRKVIHVFDIQELNANIDNVLSKRLISLDDIGTEEVSIKYGERRVAFAEVMDMAEKHDNLVIVSSNLRVEEIKQRYGDRVLDRIKATTTRVLFEGKSLRK